MRRTIQLTLVIVLLSAQASRAEVFFYLGPNGEKMVSDRPVSGYHLLHRRDSLQNAGHILANRPVGAGEPVEFQAYIISASERFGVDPALIEAVIQVESGFNPNAISRKGATGLMQLMSDTARQYQVTDRHNPRENIYAGAAHLRSLMDRFQGQLPLVIAAYNAGASAVEKYRGIPPFPETRRYVTKVMNVHTVFRQQRYGSE